MSLPQAKVQRLLFDVSFLMTGLFDQKNRYRLFREEILPALWDAREQLCALYCEDNGRRAISQLGQNNSGKLFPRRGHQCKSVDSAHPVAGRAGREEKGGIGPPFLPMAAQIAGQNAG